MNKVKKEGCKVKKERRRSKDKRKVNEKLYSLKMMKKGRGEKKNKVYGRS